MQEHFLQAHQDFKEPFVDIKTTTY